MNCFPTRSNFYMMNKINIFKQLRLRIVSLIYPRVCAACGKALLEGEQTVCTKCAYTFPKTGYEMNKDNPLAQVFYGRIDFYAVTACFFFSKKGKVQHVIHQLKYKGNAEAGLFLGREMGKILNESPLFNDADYIFPVPLHPKKERKRGYNQSELIARGAAEVMKAKVDKSHLVRTVNTATQTKKSREERWLNVKDIFDVQNKDDLKGKHVLIIDDVITTGATLEACGRALADIEGIRISVATVACAGN